MYSELLQNLCLSITVLPETVKTDIDSFIESLEQEPFDANSLKNYGLVNQDVIDTLRRVFA